MCIFIEHLQKNNINWGAGRIYFKKENMGKLEPRILVFRIFLLDKDSGQGVWTQLHVFMSLEAGQG